MNYVIAVFCCFFWGISFIIFPLVLSFNLKSISLNRRQKIFSKEWKNLPNLDVNRHDVNVYELCYCALYQVYLVFSVYFLNFHCFSLHFPYQLELWVTKVLLFLQLSDFSRKNSFNSIKSFRISVSDLYGASFVSRCKIVFSDFFSSKGIA